MPKTVTDKTLGVILVFTVIFSAYVIVSQILNLVQSYFNGQDNPLIPDYLMKFVAFPKLFIVPLFSLVAIISYKQFRASIKNEAIIFVCFGLTLSYFLFGIHIYEFIQSFNPYGNLVD